LLVHSTPLSRKSSAYEVSQSIGRRGKDDLALSAAAYWGEMTEGLLASAPYHNSKAPLERLLGYVDFRAEILRGDLPDYTCLLGTLVQETHGTHPEIRAASDKGMATHIAILTRDVEAAKRLYAAPKASATSFHRFCGARPSCQGKARP
jgi:TetR/AcrR family transcriptional repressor of nem operon